MVIVPRTGSRLQPDGRLVNTFRTYSNSLLQPLVQMVVPRSQLQKRDFRSRVLRSAAHPRFFKKYDRFSRTRHVFDLWHFEFRPTRSRTERSSPSLLGATWNVETSKLKC